jgi:hypothetical protein
MRIRRAMWRRWCRWCITPKGQLFLTVLCALSALADFALGEKTTSVAFAVLGVVLGASAWTDWRQQ